MRMFGGRWRATLVAALVIVFTVPPVSAFAWGPATRTQLEIDNMDGITQWVVRTVLGPSAAPCNTACAALERAAPKTASVLPAGQMPPERQTTSGTVGTPGTSNPAVFDELDELRLNTYLNRQRTLSSLGPLSDAAQAGNDLNPITTYSGTNFKKKLRDSASAARTWANDTAQIKQRSQIILRNATRLIRMGYDIPLVAAPITDWTEWEKSGLGSCTTPYADPLWGDCPPHFDGIIAQFDGPFPPFLSKATGSDACTTFDRGLDVPARIVELSWRWSQCNKYSTSNTEVSTAFAWGVTYSSMLSGNVVSSTNDNWSQFPTNADPETDIYIDLPNSVDLTAARTWLAAMLDSGETPELNAWIDSVLGGDWFDPTKRYPTVPDCRGVSASTCQARLTTAGFTQSATVTVLPQSEAIWNVGADLTVATEPAAGITVRPDRAVTISVNPSSVPQPSSAESTAANTVAARNIKTFNANGYTLNAIKELMMRCFRQTSAAGLSNALCSTRPIVVVGRDAPASRANAAAGLSSKPGRVLQHVGPKSPVLDGSGALANTAGGGCSASSRLLPVWHCDEFPNISTQEGYKQALAPNGIPSLRWESLSGSQRIVDLYGRFRSTTAASGTGTFRGCGLPVGTGTASEFLAVPLGGGTTLKSLAICATKDP